MAEGSQKDTSPSAQGSMIFLRVFFTPTVEHCSMATLIGLCIRVKLLETLPRRFKIDIKVSTPRPGYPSPPHTFTFTLLSPTFYPHPGDSSPPPRPLASPSP